MTQRMKRMILIIGSGMLVACASGAGQSDYDAADKTQTTVLDCADGWAKCVSQANKICGSRGFNEIDRLHDMRMTSEGRLEDQHDGRHVYREDLQFESQRETMVFRCK